MSTETMIVVGAAVMVLGAFAFISPQLYRRFALLAFAFWLVISAAFLVRTMTLSTQGPEIRLRAGRALMRGDSTTYSTIMEQYHEHRQRYERSIEALGVCLWLLVPGGLALFALGKRKKRMGTGE